MHVKKITPLSAILISINIIVGAGFFINLAPLAGFVGIWGFLNYILGAIILLPIVLSMAELASANPVPGGIYVYSKKYLHPVAGFMSGWCYFMAKATSAAVLVNVFISFFRSMSVTLQAVPHLILCYSMLVILMSLNILGLSIGGMIQYFFMSMKIIPILFIAVASCFCFDMSFLHFDTALLTGVLGSLPVVVFAFTSFEVVCSIAHLIENPTKNIRRIMLTAFGIVSVIYITLQFGIYAALGTSLAGSEKPVYLLGLKLLPQYPAIALAITVLIFGSVIAGAFGVLTSNCWNLFALAQDKLLPGYVILTNLNRNNIPWVCLTLEALISAIILFISVDQVALQNMAVFCVCLAYFLSACAAFKAVSFEKNMRLPKIVPVIALLSCFYLMMLCVKKLWGSGLSIAFLSLFCLGIVAVVWQRIKRT